MPTHQDPKPQARHPALILASQSPRRGQLLRDAGFALTQHAPPFADPDQPPEVVPEVPQAAGMAAMSPAEQYAAGLAMQKAMSMVQVVAEHALIISADTLCVSMSPGSEGALIGKPTGRDDAKAMVAGFMNGAHAVVTGVALLEVNAGQAVASPVKTTFADTAVVTFGDVPDDELARYLDTGGWQGKAGGYNLFDREDAGWPITVEGDPTTVVGLPMAKLVAALAGYGIGTTR